MSSSETQSQQVDGAVLIERLRDMGVGIPGTKRPQSDKASGKTGKPKFSVPRAGTGASDRRAANRKKGIQNQKYYLGAAKKSGKDWHLNVRGPEQYSEFIMVTPAMAKVLLEQYNPGNRRRRQNRIDAYKRDIENNRWIDTGESIEIDENGLMYNGQHRLSAVVAANQPCVFYFTFNCCCEARYAVDQGGKRDVTDKINQVLENSGGNRTGAIARGMMRGIDNTKETFTHMEIIEFTTRYGNIIEWAAKSLRGIGRRDIQAAVAKAALWYGIDAMQPFADRLNSIVFPSANDPCKRLYERVYIKKCKDGLKVYKLTLAAIEHFMNGKEIANLREREVDIFTWEPGWKMPKKED
jgi:hypothetical protein